MRIHELDSKIINFCQKISIPVARVSLFVLFFWFGFLKIVGLSPASGVVERLFNESLAWALPFSTFILLFGALECVIGILFLIPRAERVVIPIMLAHMVTTAGPLVLLPGEVWTQWFVPTMEGQYIIKNLALLALAIHIASHLEPLNTREVVS
ncbi:MAG: hypothetical protein WC030_02870 [Candidatus Paceibacterota bacterium]